MSVGDKKRFRDGVKKFTAAGQIQKKLAAEALFELVSARILVKTRSFSRVMRGLERNSEPPSLEPENPVVNHEANAIRWAIAAVSRRVPWAASCLEEAVAAQRMLARRGIPGTILFGAAGRESSQIDLFEAHACLVGPRRRSYYPLVSTSSWPPS